VNSHFIPNEGKLEQPVQLLEIKLRGRAGGRGDPKEQKECLREPRFKDMFKFMHERLSEPEEMERMTVAELIETVQERRWAANVDVKRRVGDNWVKSNREREIRGGEVLAEQARLWDDQDWNICIIPTGKPMKEEEKEEEEEEEEEDQDEEVQEEGIVKSSRWWSMNSIRGFFRR
jgi:hypothetical protein